MHVLCACLLSHADIFYSFSKNDKILRLSYFPVSLFVLVFQIFFQEIMEV